MSQVGYLTNIKISDMNTLRNALGSQTVWMSQPVRSGTSIEKILPLVCIDFSSNVIILSTSVDDKNNYPFSYGIYTSIGN